MRVYVVALLAVLCAGCANQNVWVKDSTTDAQAQKDLAECRYASEKDGRSPTSAGVQQGFQSVNPVNKCMMLREYYLVNKHDIEKK
jgi:hypothetical protein